LEILGIENRTFFSSLFPQPSIQKKFIFLFIFYFYFFPHVRAASARTGCVCADETARPRKASEGVQREGEGKEMTSSMRTGLCPHDA
jgi:hypothetical protein